MTAAAFHQDSEKIFEFPSDLGSESLSNAVAKMLRDPEGSVTYRFKGEKKTVLFQRSEGTQWIFVLGKIHRR